MTSKARTKLKKASPKRGFFLPKNLITLKDLSKSQIAAILKRARTYVGAGSSRPNKKGAITAPLQGKTIFSLFFEPSTRTQSSFEIAAKKLGADVVNFNPSTSSLSKGESLKDTIQTLDAMNPDLFVVRHSDNGAANLIASWIDKPVINAGDGSHQHPTQALLDLFTVQKHFAKIRGLKLLIVGDVKHSRVARSNIDGFKKMGAAVTLCGPYEFVPKEFSKLGVKVESDFDKALKTADIVMMLRIQKERMSRGGVIPPLPENYVKNYQLNRKRASAMKRTAVIMHPGPVNRDVEICSKVLDKNFANLLILDQVANGIPVRMSVLEMWCAQ